MTVALLSSFVTPVRAVRRGFVGIGRQKRFWVPLAFVSAIWAMALVRLFVEPSPYSPLLFNWTPSLPYHVAWLTRDVSTLNRGDFVLYAFSGKASADYPGLANQPFFKLVAGLPGDQVRVDGRNVWVGDEYVGFAKLKTSDGRPLSPIKASAVPEGFLYVRGTSMDSFDSRYDEAGLVSRRALIGKVVPWF